jgi:hypothetical protein
MRGVREESDVMADVEEACERWSRAREAWDVVHWVLSRDPTCGSPLTEGGQARAFVYQGSWAHDMPTILVIYVADDEYVTIHKVRFSEAKNSAGRA